MKLSMPVSAEALNKMKIAHSVLGGLIEAAADGEVDIFEGAKIAAENISSLDGAGK